jgi:hypothetical protein
LLVAALSLAVAGCGGGPKTIKVCSGTTDKCRTVQLDKLNKLAKLTPFPGCAIPDVSDYQGYVNWARAKPYICGGITKMGEGRGFAGGSMYYRNWSQLRQLGLWHAAYWFVRGSVGCSTQGALIVGRLKAVGYATDPLAGPLQLDEEVPDSNLSACLDAAIWAAFHRHAMVYTGPGTWPGGGHAGLALWQAEYGRHLHSFWLPVLAWQCTDGVYGCVRYIPGIGYGDVSVDMGITKLTGAPPPPPRPHCFGPHWQHTGVCLRARYGFHRVQADIAKLQKLLAPHQCRPCGGWLHALRVDQAKLTDFQRKFG